MCRPGSAGAAAAATPASVAAAPGLQQWGQAGAASRGQTGVGGVPGSAGAAAPGCCGTRQGQPAEGDETRSGQVTSSAWTVVSPLGKSVVHGGRDQATGHLRPAVH
ncbi:hypothetical protein HaLaN_23157 [Haematococcus lacustris]|uniref:Uncharacterized protein n=1 Tax=Haematococcus lacustris TaxID=44745 RepID=A0A6A0A105_HAELA|nr:hypothetical protein HaLaN_23157 [Haematococcus lacustris]